MLKTNIVLFKNLNIANNIKNLLFPEICLSCNNFLISGEKTICTACRHEIPLTNYSKCKDNPTEKIFFGRIKVENASSFVWYRKNSIVQQIIHNLKYKGHQEIGTFFGNWFGSELNDSLFYKNIDIVLPVPMHLKKLKKRKYNQVTEFGKCIANQLNASFNDDILIQEIETATQTKKNRESRWEEKSKAYKISNGANIENKHLLLVDDVITTGSTIEACIKTLKNYQNCKVSVVTIAITA